MPTLQQSEFPPIYLIGKKPKVAGASINIMSSGGGIHPGAVFGFYIYIVWESNCAPKFDSKLNLEIAWPKFNISCIAECSPVFQEYLTPARQQLAYSYFHEMSINPIPTLSKYCEMGPNMYKSAMPSSLTTVIKDDNGDQILDGTNQKNIYTMGPEQELRLPTNGKITLLELLRGAHKNGNGKSIPDKEDVVYIDVHNNNNC